MAHPDRITPKDAYERSKSGASLLVCAYDDDDKFSAMHLEGAISFSEFKLKLPALSKNQEIIFYCG